jgi:hypothetical protein
VETEHNRVIKPDRAPDFVIVPGHAFWWPELVFLHVYGNVYNIEVDQEDARFYYTLFDKRAYFTFNIKAEYDKWLYEEFESKVLGAEDE